MRSYTHKDNNSSFLKYSSEEFSKVIFSNDNEVITKENCMSLSNESESFLLTSSGLERTGQEKKQKRLNARDVGSEKMREMSAVDSHGIRQKQIGKMNGNSNRQNCNRIKDQNANNDKFNDGRKYIDTDGDIVKDGRQLSEMINKSNQRLEQLQSVVKLLFTKTLQLQQALKQKDNQMIEIQTRLQDAERIAKQNQHLKINALNDPEISKVKHQVQMIKQKVDKKVKQFSQVLELQVGMITEKLLKCQSKTQSRLEQADEKLNEFVQLLEEVVKGHNQSQTIKCHNCNKDATCIRPEIDNTLMQSNRLSKLFSSSKNQPTTKVSQDNFFNSENYPKPQISSQKSRSISRTVPEKSKISYYLSKSEFNDTTTLGDMSMVGRY